MTPLLETRITPGHKDYKRAGAIFRTWWKGPGGMWLVMTFGLLSLLAAHQLPAAYRLDLTSPGAAERLNNFYEREQNAGGFYRWSQPVAQIHLLPVDSSLKICLELENPSPEPRTLQLSFNRGGQAGPVFQDFRLEGGAGRFCSETGWSAAFLPGDFTLYKDSFLNNIWFGPALEMRVEPLRLPGERRELGVVVRSLEVATGPASGRPGIPTLLELLITLLIAAGTWTLLRSVSANFLPVAAGTGLPLFVWSGWVAFGRVELAGKIEFVLFATLATLLALTSLRMVGPAMLNDLKGAANHARSGHLPARPFVGLNKATALWQNRMVVALPTTALAVLALNASGQFWPEPSEQTNWGLRRFTALPWPLVLLIIGVTLAGALIASRFQFNTRRGLHLNPYLLLLITVAGAALLFYLLRTRNSYGDGNELVAKLELFLRYRAETGRNDFMIWREREPLDFALHFSLWRAMLRFEWWQPAYTYVFTSVAAGGVFVAVAWLTVVRLVRSTTGQVLLLGLMFSSATMLVFFGYIESYTFITLAALVYLWLALLAIDRRVSVAWPALALMVAVLLHPQAIFLGPSMIGLLLWRAGFFLKTGFEIKRLAKDAGLAGLLALSVLAAGGFLLIMYNYSWSQWGIARQQFGGADNGAFKPLFEAGVRPNAREYYPVLSTDYLAFHFNLEMLVAPLAGPLLAVGGLGAALQRRKTSFGWVIVSLGIIVFFLGLVWSGAQAVTWLALLGLGVQAGGLWLLRGRLQDAQGFILATCALYTWLFALAWNPDLGSNDWDLLSLHGIFTSLLAGYIVTRLLEGHRYFKRAVAFLVSSALALGSGWIIYNAFFTR